MSLFHLHESRFDPSAGRISAYFSQLFILSGPDYFRYCILDTEKNTFIALADYQAGVPLLSPDAWSAALENLVNADEFLYRKYPAVIIANDTPWTTMMPEAFYEQGQVKNHLQLNPGLPSELNFHADHLPELKAWNAWAMEPGKEEAIRRHFPQGILLHSATPLLKRISLTLKQEHGPAGVYLHFNRQKFDLAVFSDNSLQFFNTFHFENNEDILYFTLYAMEQLKIRPADIRLFLLGDIDMGSDAVGLLKEYLPDISSSGRPEAFSYSPFFDFPASRYPSLFGIGLCGS